MVTKILRSLFLVGVLFFSYKSYAQPAFSVQNVKGACEGFNNGSFEVLVTAGTGTIEVFYFGGGPFFGGPIVATIGNPVLISGLAGAAFPGRSYTIIVQDGVSSTNGLVSILTYPALLSATIDNVVDNTDCLLSNGSIDITPSGGSGAYTFFWEETSLGFTANTEDISGLLGGNYQLTLSDPSTNCVLVLPPINVANPSPLLFNVITPTPVAVCAGTDWILDLDGSEVGATYEVFRNNVIATGITMVGTGSPISFTIPAGSFANGDNFKVRAINGICSGDMTGVVVANIAPLPTATTSGGGTVCSGSPLPDVTFTFTGTLNFSFTYTDGVGTFPVNNYASTTYTIPNAPAGTYSVTALSGGGGCVATSLGGSVQVIVNPSPTSAVLSGTASVCAGGSTDLTVTITGGTSPYSITLDNGIGTINGYVSGTAIPVSPAATTSYNMVGNVVDANGCSVAGSGSATVTVNLPPASAVLTGAATICLGSSTDLIVTITGGASPYSITLDNGIGTINGYVSGAPIPVSPVATTTYNMVGNVVDANGCSVAGSGSATVTVNPSPTSAVLSGTAAICSGSSTDLIVTITGGVSPYSITLDNGIGTINGYVSGAPIPVSPVATTTYNMVGNIVDANGCSVAGSGSATVTVNLPPTSAVLTGAATICLGSSTDLIVTITGGASPYSITLDNGLGTINGYVSGTPIPVSPAATTTYNMVGNVVDANGCSVAGSGSATVTVNLPPTSAVLTGAATICLGSSTDLIVTITGGASPYSITLDNGLGTINGYVSGTPIPVSPAVTTTYNMVGNVVDANGCSVAGSGSATVTVNLPPASAVLTGAATICLGSSTDLIVTITGGASPYSITLDNGLGTINGYVSGTPIPVSPAATTTYNMVGNVVDANGCSVAGSGSATVTVNPSPTSSVLSGTAAICSGSSTDLIVTITGGTSPYSITLDNGIGTINGYVSGAPIPVSPVATTTYNMVGNIVDANGCSVAGSGSATVTVNLPPASAVLTGAATICLGSSTDLIVTITGGASPYSITLDNGLGTINGYVSGTPIPVSPAATTTYNMVGNVVDANGCSVAGSGSATVTVNPSPTSSVLSGTAAICSGSSTDLIVTITGGTSPYSITLDNGLGTINGYVSGTPIPVSPAVTTTYNMVGNVVDANGCSVAGSGSATVTVNPSPTSAVLSGTATICSGSSNDLIVTITGGVSPYSITLDNGIGTINGYLSGTPIPVSPLTTATYNMVGNVTDAGGCAVAGSGSAIVTVTPAADPSLAVAVTIDPLCVGGISEVTVALSQVGIDYQLRNDADDSAVGSPVPGTGGTINLSTGVLNSTTTFNILATGTSCPPVELTSLATVNVAGVIDASLVLVAAANPICEGSSTDIQIANSEVGVTYQLRDDATDALVGAPVAGTGLAILLPTGNLSVTSTFNVLANNGVCSIELTDLETVNVDLAPDPNLLVGVTLDPLCVGGISGVTVALSQVGVNYQLRDDADDSNVGAAVAGTGGTIDLSTGVLNATTVFNILATSGVCPNVELTTLATINVAGSIDAGLVVTSSANPICAGGSTLIQVENSEVGVNYQLRDDLTNTNIGVPVAGDGATIDLPTGIMLVTTTFNVLASNGTCSIELTDLALINVIPGPALGLVVNPASALICPGTSTNIVVSASEVGVDYQLRNDAGNTPIGSPVAGTGGNIILPTGILAVSTTFNVLATAGICAVQLTTTATVNIRPLGDPVCSGVSDCTNFSAILPTIITQPTCLDQDGGEISFTVGRADGTPTTFRIILSLGGLDQTKFTTGTVSFNDLSSGLYQYTVIDEGNGKSCGPVDFFLDLKTQVDILSKMVTSNVTCFGGTDGNVIMSVSGSGTGEYWFKYVLNGVESGAQTFTPGAPLPGGLPADDTNFIVLVVDESFAFSCPDTVMVRIRHTFPMIDFTVSSTDVLICNGTDGAIQVASISGGDSGANPLQIRLKKAVSFSVDPSGYIVLFDFEDVVAGLKDYVGLSQGDYIVDVRDHLDCIQSKPITVKAPGQISLSSISTVATDASCANDGASGSIKVTISDVGMFQVALSMDQLNAPADSEFVDYDSPSLPSLTFDNLVGGVYYLYARPITTKCPTRTDAIALGGVMSVKGFEVLSNCDNVNLTLNNIKGQRDAPFVIRVFNNEDKFSQIDSLTAPSIPLSDAVSFIYVAPLQHSFLINPGAYRFVMVQNQTTGVGTCTLVSDTVVFSVRELLGVVLGEVKPSFPNPKRTGSIEIADILGGTRFLSEDNELFYEVSLYTAENDIVVFDWEEVKLNPQNKFSKLYDYLPPGIYRIKVRDDGGCVNTLDVEIPLDPSIFVPNIFTPNDDSVNDEFEILNLPLTGKHKLIVSNRWGNEVFTSMDYRVGTFWDATGTSDGIYYYRLQVDGGQTYTGWVEILRGSKP